MDISRIQRKYPAIDEAERQLLSSSIQDFLGASADQFLLTPLKGGRSPAKVYTLASDDATYVIKITDPTLAREARESALAILNYASEQGCAPRVRWTDLDGRIVISDFISGELLSKRLLHKNPGLIEKLAKNLCMLHSGRPESAKILSQAIPSTTNFDRIRFRVQQIQTFDAASPSQLDLCLDRIKSIEEALQKHEGKSVPCHNDLILSNVLIEETPAVGAGSAVPNKSDAKNGDFVPRVPSEERVYFVDWDTSGLSDRFRDLATIGLFLNLSKEQSTRFLDHYFERDCTKVDYARYFLFRQSHLILGALWALQYPYFAKLLLKYPVQLQLTREQMDLTLKDPHLICFDDREGDNPLADLESPVEFQTLALQCVKQFLVVTSSSEFAEQMSILQSTQS